MAETTMRLKLDPGVLVADPAFHSYYKHHVILHEDKAREQLALPEHERDPFWWMLMELDEEASTWWMLTHKNGQ